MGVSEVSEDWQFLCLLVCLYKKQHPNFGGVLPQHFV